MIYFMHALEQSKQQVNSALDYYFHLLYEEQTMLIKAMRYSVLFGGKRLRSFLIYHTGKLFGIAPESLHAATAAVECIHAYSLIHDDLPAMDNAIQRRGQPTCHIKFGETMAILAGDALQTLAFGLLADQKMLNVSLHDRLKIIATLATASGATGMCLGQVLDLSAKKDQVSIEQLEKIYHHKTGAIIRASVRIGALSAGESSKYLLEHLDDYAVAIGLAFQIQDDILDITGQTNLTGKKQGLDSLLKKITYPTLLGVEQAKKQAYNLYEKSLAALEPLQQQGYDTSMLVALSRYIIERDR